MKSLSDLNSLPCMYHAVLMTYSLDMDGVCQSKMSEIFAQTVQFLPVLGSTLSYHLHAKL